MYDKPLFRGVRGTSFKTRILFILYSVLIATAVYFIIKKAGFIGDELILARRNNARINVSALYFAIFGVTVLYEVYFLGIQYNLWNKVLLAGLFPTSASVTIRLLNILNSSLLRWYLFAVLFLLPFLMLILGIWYLIEAQRNGEMEARGTWWALQGAIKHLFHKDIIFSYGILLFVSIIIMVSCGNLTKTLQQYEQYTQGYETSEVAETIELIAVDAVNSGIIMYASESYFVPGEEGRVWNANKDTLKLLKADTFDSLTYEDKLNVLKTLLDIECDYLFGTNGEISLATGIMPLDSTMGYYSHYRRLVVLSEKALESRDIAIAVLLHEVKHAQQHNVVDNLGAALDTPALKNTEAYQWKMDIDNFYSLDSDYDINEWVEYHGQSLELDADNYADEWTGAYINFIDHIDE